MTETAVGDLTAKPGPEAGTRWWLWGRLAPVVDLAGPWRTELRYGVASGMTQQVLFVSGGGIAAYAAGRAALGASYNGLTFYLLGLIVIVLLQIRTPWLEALSFQAIANRVQVRLRGDIYDALDHLTPSGLAGRRSGELGSTAMADVAVIQRFFAETLAPLVMASILPALTLVGIAALSWPLAILLLPFLAGAGVVPVWLRGSRSTAEADDPAAMSAEIVDDIQGLRELVTFSGGPTILAELWEGDRRTGRIRAARARRAAAERVAIELFATAGVIAVLTAGAALVAHHHLSRTFLPPVVVLAALAFGPISRLAAATKQLDEVTAAADRIFALLQTRDPVDDRTSPVVAELSERPGVEFREVSFRYRQDLPLALDGVTFAVAPGETVALAGHSGAGKSTCVNLLLQFWKAESGSIIVGGADVRDLPANQLHNLVGYVAQDVYLFNTTIRENLRLGRLDATDTEVEAAARAAMAWEFISALPDGLDTHTGERGSQLSGGQRQRLAIARAFLADTPILLLDEPASNLDTENEQLLVEAMGRLRHGRTTMIVAHRLSTIQNADRIVLLDHGGVAATGTHVQLLASSDTYAALIASQLN